MIYKSTQYLKIHRFFCRTELESVFTKNTETRQKSPKTSVLRRSSTEPVLPDALNQASLGHLQSQQRKSWHGSTNMKTNHRYL